MLGLYLALHWHILEFGMRKIGAKVELYFIGVCY